ncbi:MAG: DSD1 family PLP-dependent enzyme [Acidobacteria bacterium]|nr:DSD1 family PLP-dependent enzyme [Acidobacteriota bacterium]
MNPSTVAGVQTPASAATSKPNGYDLAEVERRLAKGKGIEGVSKQDLATPSLILDLDAFESNIRTMAEHAKAHSINLRPHVKTHKTPEIAKRQIAAGALGVCCATIREAEVMSDAGIGGLLVTSECVGPNKMARLIRLTRQRPETMSTVDNPWHAERLSEAATASGVTLNVMVDTDPIGRRSGVAPGALAVELGKKIDSLPGLRLRGVHGYSGASSHVTGFAARKEHSESVMTPVIGSFLAMQKAGLPAEIMSGGSTGTYNIDSELEGMTELQVGSYVVMDVDYRRIGGRSGEVYTDFQPALTVLSTVMSKCHDDIATIDAGLKAFSTDRAFPPDVLLPGVTFSFNGDEHGRLHLKDAEKEVKLGDKVELIVPHCDPNVNLYDRMFVCKGDQVVEIWPVAARGHV